MFEFPVVAEAEELNSRLQSTRQRVSELERTLSSVSAQQKQLEKVCADYSAMTNTCAMKYIYIRKTLTQKHDLKVLVFLCVAAQQRA